MIYDYLNMNINFTRSTALLGPINFESADVVFSNIHKAMDKDPNAETFLIINSGGGIVDVGNMIIDLLPTLSPKLVTVGTGVIGSMAIPVFLCGHKRVITRHTRFFFHEIGRSYKDARLGVGEVQSHLGDMKALQRWYIDYIVNRTEGKISARRLSGLMKQETTLYPDDLKNLGFFSEII